MPTDPTKYLGKKIKQIPYDQSGKASAVLVLPIVTAGVITGYLPAKAVDNGDGTASLDTTATLVGDIVLADMNVERWGGTVQTGADLTPIFQDLKVQLDKLTFNGDELKVDANVTIDTSALATEATLSALKTDFEAVDFATQTTLATLLTQADFDAVAATLATESTLQSVDGHAADISTAITTVNVSTIATAAAVSVDNTATLLLGANADRREYTIVHEDPSETVYIGFSNAVTTTTGFPLVGNQIYGSEKYRGAVYARTTGATVSVRVIEATS